MRLAAFFILLFCGVAHAQQTVPGILLNNPLVLPNPVQFTGVPATLTLNGQGTVGTSLTLGAIIQGQGSINDVTIANKGGTAICKTATGTTTLNCVGIAINGTAQTFPASGLLVGTTDAQTITNKTISGASNTITNIANTALTNSSIAIGGTSVSLGGATGAVGTPLSSLFLTAGTITGSGGNQLTLNTLAGSQASNVLYKVNGTAAFSSGVNTSGAYSLFDIVRGGNLILANPNSVMAIAPSGAINVGLGTPSPNMLFSVANVWGADASGHPFCDIRAFGGGTGSASADNTAFTNALSTCAGGMVFIDAGSYHNQTGHWTVQAGTSVVGAGKGAAIIYSTLTTDDVFQCSGGGNSHQLFQDFAIRGPAAPANPAATVPSSGYGINCTSGGNSERYERLNIDGTANGIFVGGTNCVIADNRIENIMQAFMIYEGNGGCGIHDNQLDNNSEFNAIGGTAAFEAYPGSGQAVATNVTVDCNGYFYLAISGGTTAGSSCASLAVVPMYTNITDGSVTWQVIGGDSLIIVEPGTETWIRANDMTSPAGYAVAILGNIGAQNVWVWENDIAGELYGGVIFKNATAFNQVFHNKFLDIGRVGNSTTEGFAIWDQSSSDSTQMIQDNLFQNTLDGSILLESSASSVQGNTISGHNLATTTYCAITYFGSLSGTNISLNNISNSAPGAICGNGASGASFTSAIGNTVGGATISLQGSNQVIGGTNTNN